MCVVCTGTCNIKSQVHTSLQDDIKQGRSVTVPTVVTISDDGKGTVGKRKSIASTSSRGSDDSVAPGDANKKQGKRKKVQSVSLVSEEDEGDDPQELLHYAKNREEWKVLVACMACA